MLALVDIDRFFIELDKRLDFPVRILITGAIAGAMLGYSRASDDIDFEVALPQDRAQDQASIEKVEQSINDVYQKLGIPVQYSDSIQGWSQISLLDYREKALNYKKIGKIELLFLSPGHWAIGKFARYLAMDRIDLVQVLRKRSISADQIISDLAKALRASPLSDKSREFKNHVLDFLKTEGKSVWGKSFSSKDAIELFKKEAGLR